ncbi:MAG TPA: cytochrome c oxidase subunit II [Devosia sp.]
MARAETSGRTFQGIGLVAVSMTLSACTQQSVLHPASREAGELSALTWFMFAAAVVIWGIVMGAAIYAVVGKLRPKSERFADRFIIVGGVAFPTVSLAILLVFGLSLLPSWSEADTPDLRIHVVGEQFWWRFGYELPDGSILETANELHLPVGATVEFVLTSTDVIHSFWIPALNGKMDTIPGRTNLLRMTPTKPGIYRGACAEFCGRGHALMSLVAEVHDPGAYQQWISAQLLPASPVGGDAFVSAGCGGCHVVRGVTEAGAVGPDLTHFASRRTFGAATKSITADNLSAWLAAPEHVKPGARMPSFGALPEADRDAIVAYLLTLR